MNKGKYALNDTECEKQVFKFPAVYANFKWSCYSEPYNQISYEPFIEPNKLPPPIPARE